MNCVVNSENKQALNQISSINHVYFYMIWDFTKHLLLVSNTLLDSEDYMSTVAPASLYESNFIIFKIGRYVHVNYNYKV